MTVIDEKALIRTIYDVDTDVIVDRTEMATDLHELDVDQTFERIDLGTTSETGVWTGLANPTRVRV